MGVAACGFAALPRLAVRLQAYGQSLSLQEILIAFSQLFVASLDHRPVFAVCFPCCLRGSFEGHLGDNPSQDQDHPSQRVLPLVVQDDVLRRLGPVLVTSLGYLFALRFNCVHVSG